MLEVGRNCWRIETAGRAACLVDGAAYFAAAKAAMAQAQHSILLLGWNFAEEAGFDPDGSDDGWPNLIGDFLHEAVHRREGLRVHVLVWDKASVLALGRRRLPGTQALHMQSERLDFRLDAEHPAFATHHQKVLVVDDAVAFCGGFDFAANRWDTRGHEPGDPRRRMPNGAPYDAHHDVMMAVDGNAARALGDLARERWRRATGERLSPVPAGLDRWPGCAEPDFREVPVAISRTAPQWRDGPEIREIEALYLDSIAAARETIYMESQYLASHEIGQALAARLQEPDGPEIILVTPKRAPSWTETVAMDNARTEIARRLIEADRHGRFRLFAAVNRGQEIVVHSKVTVVDDRFLRIGSSNLNSRSMGVDTECDLAIKAEPEQARLRETILRVRNDLIAEHLGVTARRVASSIAEHKSLLGAVDALNGASERHLAQFPPPRTRTLHWLEHNPLTDPAKPLGARPGLPPARGPGRPGWGIVAGASVLAVLCGLLVLRRRPAALRQAPSRRTRSTTQPPLERGT